MDITTVAICDLDEEHEYDVTVCRPCYETCADDYGTPHHSPCRLNEGESGPAPEGETEAARLRRLGPEVAPPMPLTGVALRG